MGKRGGEWKKTLRIFKEDPLILVSSLNSIEDGHICRPRKAVFYFYFYFLVFIILLIFIVFLFKVE